MFSFFMHLLLAFFTILGVAKFAEIILHFCAKNGINANKLHYRNL